MCGIDQIYIDGTFVTPRSRERFDLFNPATGRVIGQVRLADAADARGDRRGQGRLPGHGAHEPGRAAGAAAWRRWSDHAVEQQCRLHLQQARRGAGCRLHGRRQAERDERRADPPRHRMPACGRAARGRVRHRHRPWRGGRRRTLRASGHRQDIVHGLDRGRQGEPACRCGDDEACHPGTRRRVAGPDPGRCRSRDGGAAGRGRRLSEQRPSLHRRQPHPRAGGEARRGGNSGRSGGGGDQARRSARSCDRDRTHGQPEAVGPRAALHPARAGRRRQAPGRRRRQAARPGGRPLRPSDRVRWRRQWHDHRPRGDFRPGAGDPRLAQRGRGDRQRHRLRAAGLRAVRRSGAGASTACSVSRASSSPRRC